MLRWEACVTEYINVSITTKTSYLYILRHLYMISHFEGGGGEENEIIKKNHDGKKND